MTYNNSRTALLTPSPVSFPSMNVCHLPELESHDWQMWCQIWWSRSTMMSDICCSRIQVLSLRPPGVTRHLMYLSRSCSSGKKILLIIETFFLVFMVFAECSDYIFLCGCFTLSFSKVMMAIGGSKRKNIRTL